MELGKAPSEMNTPTKAVAKQPVGRWHVTSRVVAALIPGFVLTNTFGIFLALALPGGRLDTIAFATVISFIVYCAIVMWIFSVKTLKTVWTGLLGSIVFTGGGAWLLYTLGANT